MASSNDPRRFPPELLYKVLAQVVGNSVHAICTFPGNIEWELHIFENLRGVSSSFKSITTEIFCKAFVIPQGDSKNLSRLIAENFGYLRILGMKLHHSSDYGDSFPSPDTSLVAPLMHGYALFIVAMDMRYNAIHNSSETYELSSLTILKALHIALGLRKCIEPEGVGEVMCNALKNEQELVHNGLEIVRAFSKLRNHIGSFRESANGSLARVQSASQTFIHKELQAVEKAHQRYTQVMVTHQFTPGGAQRPISELPGVIPVLRDLYALQIGADEHDIQRRLGCLVNKWSTSCPFLNLQGAHPHQ